ncbi:kinase [Streptococcus suis]|nr:kinase [Streptococcus suis]NQI33975.1 kinase [Streptococcus suis]
MKKYLVLLAGPPATGKSYLVSKIRSVLSELYLVSPDEFKQDLAENIGFSNVEEKNNLEKIVWDCYYQALDVYMKVGKRFVVTEYPFSFKQKDNLSELASKYGYEVITIRLVAEFETLWKRRLSRDLSKERHLSFIMSHYKYGDSLDDRTKADDLITREEFYNIIEDRQYNNFSLGRLYEIDVTDYSKVNYNEILEMFEEMK